MKGKKAFKIPLYRSRVSDITNSNCSKAAPTKRLYQVWRGKNKFILGGRIIFGPDANSILLTVCLIVTPLMLFVVFVSFRLADRLGKPLGYLVTTAAIAIGASDVILLLLTSGRDPGIIPRNAHPPEPEDYDSVVSANVSTDHGSFYPGGSAALPATRDVSVNGVVVKVKYCHTCMLYRPPRCSHCSVCNNCVDRFDHHCPWVGQCIGKRNYRSFFMFISSTTFLCLFVFSFCWVNLLLITKQYDCSFWRALLQSPVSGFLIAYTFVTAWFVGGLTAFHSYLICTNQTTYENFRYRYGAKGNPYNRGCVSNVAETFLSSVPESKNNFRAMVPADSAYFHSSQFLGPASEAQMSFDVANASFDMAKVSFDLEYAAPWGKRPSVASSDWGDVYLYGQMGALERCATQPPHSIFGTPRGLWEGTDDDVEAIAAEIGMEYARPHRVV